MGIFDIFGKRSSDDNSSATTKTVNLRKAAKVNLVKGQKVNLTKNAEKDGQSIKYMFIGSNWSRMKNGEKVDLDSSVLLYNKNKELIDVVYYGNLRSADGSIKHSGDDRSGDSYRDDKDNEVISTDFDKLPNEVEYIVSIMNNFTHQNFGDIPSIELRIYTNETGNKNDVDNVIVSYKLDNNQEYSGCEAIILGHFYKKDEKWKFSADGIGTGECSIRDIANGSARRVIEDL